MAATELPFIAKNNSSRARVLERPRRFEYLSEVVHRNWTIVLTSPGASLPFSLVPDSEPIVLVCSTGFMLDPDAIVDPESMSLAADAELMKAVEQGERDYAAGRFVTGEELRRRDR